MNILDQWKEEDEKRQERLGHVLVVDDEQDVREGLAQLLVLEGFEVTTANNGAAAIERAKETRFDVILTDLRMPGLTGVETLAGLKQIHPDVPVIVVTGYASDETAQRCLREGAYNYVMKPFDLDPLLRLIREASGAPASPPPTHGPRGGAR